MSSAKKPEETQAFFGMLFPYICDEKVTEIHYNGNQLWLTDATSCKRKSNMVLSKKFVCDFTDAVAGCEGMKLSEKEPVAEVVTERLRITVVHESVAQNGRAITILKAPPFARLDEETLLKEEYCSKQILTLLKNCVRARKNIVFCGEAGVGKTQCATFFSQYISPDDRVVTIEDNPRWHYSKMHPDSDCVELRVTEQMGYGKAIETGLRLNPKWMLLSEGYSPEIARMIEGFAAGVRGITTLCARDVRSVPEKMAGMSRRSAGTGRLENEIYRELDLAVLIRKKEAKDDDGQWISRPYIDQIGYFSRYAHKNHTHMIVENGKITEYGMPKKLTEELAHVGIFDPLMEVEEEELVAAKEGIKLTTQPKKEELKYDPISFAPSDGTYMGQQRVVG